LPLAVRDAEIETGQAGVQLNALAAVLTVATPVLFSQWWRSIVERVVRNDPGMLTQFTQSDFEVSTVGPCRYSSPLHGGFVNPTTRIRYEIKVEEDTVGGGDSLLEKAGPRKEIYYDPTQVRAAVVTCGGLSPGFNNVVRAVFHSLHYNYKVPEVLGIRNGYLGMNPESGLPPVVLTNDFVDDIDKLGGTVLGSSRGQQDVAVMASFLVDAGVNILFCIGGDGTQRGAHMLQQELQRRNLAIAVVGIPKTIDNDIPFVWQSFGHATALDHAAEVIKGAHVEARSAIHGIGLVKLMGRNAGFIAAGATLASQEVNFTLIPEVKFPLRGPGGFLDALENRMRHRGHAVIVVAEGAGQHLFQEDAASPAFDASGNQLHQDIGVFMRQKIIDHFAERRFPINIKYLDPSYYIRSTPANTRDRILSDQMGRLAVDAAMAGKTDMLIGHLHNQFVHVPIATAIQNKKQLDVSGEIWESVVRDTGQPRW
jgi:6-phosphofructokinase 1